MKVFYVLVVLGVLLAVSESKIFDGKLLKSKLFGLFKKKTPKEVPADQVEVDEWGDNVPAEEKTDVKWEWDAKWPSQVAFVNDTTDTGIVLDSETGIVVAEEVNGDKVAIDVNTDTVTVGKSPIETEEEFEKKFHDYHTAEEAKKGTPEHPMVVEPPTNDLYPDSWLDKLGVEEYGDYEEETTEPVTTTTEAVTTTTEAVTTTTVGATTTTVGTTTTTVGAPTTQRTTRRTTQRRTTKKSEVPVDKYKNKLLQLLNQIMPTLVCLILKINERVSHIYIPCGMTKLVKILKMIFAPVVWVLKLFSSIMFAPYVKGWLLFKNGIRAFINIFKWIYKICNELGDIFSMVKNKVRFALALVMKAANGAIALYEILKGFAAKVNLARSAFRKLLTTPELLCKFINGLGGMISDGVTGLFGIFSKMFTFSWVDQILDMLKRFVDFVLDCIDGGRPKDRELIISVNKLEEISRQQKAKYHNAHDLANFDSFLRGLKGGDFTIKGVSVRPIVTMLEDAVLSAKETVLKLLNFMNPFAPMKSLVAKLFVDTILSLNTTTGPAYVKQLFPVIDFSDDVLQGTNRNLAVDIILPDTLDASIINLPTPEMLKSMPIVRDIYHEFNKAALEYTNSTLEFLLNNQYVEELVDFTTTVMGLRQY